MDYVGLYKLYPEYSSSTDGFVSQEKQAIIDSILKLIKTEKGSRIYDPNIGTTLHRLIFELNIEEIAMFARTEIEEVITKYEPRVKLLDIDVKISGTLQEKLIIYLNCEIIDLHEELYMELILKREKEWINASII